MIEKDTDASTLCNEVEKERNVTCSAFGMVLGPDSCHLVGVCTALSV